MPGSPRRPRQRLDLDSLNPPQREAVCHGEGPLLVLAGAGSGKTRVIIYRIARLLRDGVPPEQVLGVTFTNKAAREMRERLAALCGAAAAEVLLTTFHSLGLRILREELRAAGLKKGFCIYDANDQLSLIRDLMRHTRVADRRLDPARVLGLVQRAKASGLQALPQRGEDDYADAAAAILPRYVEQLRAFNAVDFDDLLLRALEVLRQPAPGKRWAERFAYLLVDEYQDTSPEQLELLRALAGARRNVCAVGDDDQSIYAWRGAQVDNILRFGAHFAGTREVVLDQNYRSTGHILAAANAVIQHNAARKPKRLWSAGGAGDPVEVVACSDGEDEAAFVTRTVLQLAADGARLDDIAVLYRANVQSRAFEEAFALEKLPYRVVGGQAFHERKEVRDGLGFLSLLRNPYDELALRRIINVPPRGIGPGSVERLSQHAEAHGKTLWWALGQAEQIEGLPDSARAGIRGLLAVLRPAAEALRKARPAQLGALVHQLFEQLDLYTAVLKADDSPGIAEQRLENLHEVRHMVERFAQDNPGAAEPLSTFLNAVALTQRSEGGDDERGGQLTLMTLHSAKGLEFPYVFLVGVEEELLPHRRTLELGGELSEERRLCYVGMTRARKRLWLCHAVRRTRRGKVEPRAPSRFLQELPDGAEVARRNRDAPLAGAEATQFAEDFFRKMQRTLEA